MSSHRFEIAGTWNGEPLLSREEARVELVLGDTVEIRVDATYYDDPAPCDAPARLDGLWEFEVVELFLLGTHHRYLEIELGPHGHWLALYLEGQRRIVDDDIAIAFEAHRTSGHWSGRAVFDRACLPEGLGWANVYSIHGVGPHRRYLAMTPVLGEVPDFHRVESFDPIPDYSIQTHAFRGGPPSKDGSSSR